MAAKVLVSHLLRFEDFKQVEKSVFAFITSRKGENTLDADYLESVDAIVSYMLKKDMDTICETESVSIKMILQKVVTVVCLPLLRAPRPSTYDNDKGDKLKLFQLTYKVVSRITFGSSLEIGQHIWSLLFKSLKNFVNECKHGFGEGHEVDAGGDMLQVATALDLLGSLLEYMNNCDNETRLNYILETVLDVLKVVRSGSLLFKITGKILPALLYMNEKYRFQNSEKIWETVKCLLLQEQNEDEGITGFFGSYAAMSSLADVYFTLNPKPVFKVHHNPVFWTMLQRGLVNIDPLVRKRCLYLVQKAVQLSSEACEKVFVNRSSPVFWWNPDSTEALLKIWHQYVFILEILEEKQLHVIRPVLHRLDELIDAAKKTSDFQPPLLHVSWLTVVVHRGAIHENRFIKKWAIASLLTLDLHKVPLLEDTSTRRFASDTLIMLLKEPSLYAKIDGEGNGEPSKLTKELIGFFNKCFTLLRGDLQAAFVNQIMSSIRQHNMSHVPLTFICQGLANLPRVPGVGAELLTNMRLILSDMSGNSVVMRGAVQSFMLRTAMNVMDPSCVHLDDVFAFLGLFVKEESLSRGISLWEEVGQWLSVNVDVWQRTTKDLFSFLDGKLRKFLKGSVSDKNCSQAVPLAKFLLLCCDSSVIDTSEMAQLFDVVFSSISKAQSNPYHPISSCWQAVELLRALFYELRSVVPSEEVADNIVIALTNRLHEVLHGLMQCIQRTINQEKESVSFHGYRACFELLDEVRSLWLTQKFPSDISRRCLALINKLVDLGLRDLSGEALAKPTTTKVWLRLVVSERLIAWVLACADIPGLALAEEQRSRIFESVRSWNLANDLRYPNSNVAYSDTGSLLKQDDWRVVVQDHIAVQWECVAEAVKEKPHGTYVKDNSTTNGMCTLSGNTVNDVVDVCIEALSLVSGRAFLPCLTALQLFLPELIRSCDESSAARLLETAWSVLMEIRKRFSAQFWQALDIVVRIVFASELLILPTEHPLTLHVQKYWESLLTIAHDQSGLVSVAVRHICKVFSSVSTCIPSDVRLRSLQANVKVFADVCVFGPVHKKDTRLLFDTAAYMKSMGPHCGAVCLTKRKEFECETACVRVDIFAFLLSLEAREGTRAAPFLVGLTKALLERNRVLSEAKASRFLNSENHRQKQRLWQTILVLVSCVGDDAFAAEVAPRVFQELQSDNQTSVRFLMEWTLVRVLSKHAGNMHLLWRQFENIFRKRLGYVSSLISIAVHVLLALDDSKYQVDYLFHLLPAILPCAFLSHSQTRAYLLDTLRLISEVFAGDVWARVTERFPVVKSCLEFVDCVVEGEKEKGRLLKDRSLFSLHPVRDFSIEAIFETVPRMAGVVEEEVIPPTAFQTEGSLPWTEAKVVPLYRRIADTGNEKESVPSEPTLESNAAGQSVKNPSRSSFASAVSDVQKKITPWQVNAPPQEDLDAFDRLQQRPIQRRVGNLVVVASLIDRAPNLGGLCRTCEIFGASKLVLGSKHVVSETGFQSLSVSAEKWMEVEEVKVNDLVGYLSGMRKEGYTIVGVEQTAQSKKLTDFQFPCSTVLVLGNEKAGIPVELIQLLDECVEIPQHGIIRSLNVHVSGALFIWEYSRQHLNDN